jgi:SAM-dependent methyltransferase
MGQGAIEREDFFRRLDATYRRPGHLMRRKMELVESLVRPGGWLLDIGCGTGEALARLRGHFEYRVGLDASTSAVRYAWHRVGSGNGVELIQGSAVNLCFWGSIFDCCLLLDVLEHLEQPSLALSQVARVLKAGGQLVVTVPNWTNWVTAKLLGLNREHHTFHTPGGWKRLLERCGFHVHLYRAVRLPFLEGDFWAAKFPYLGMCIVLVAERRAEV